MNMRKSLTHGTIIGLILVAACYIILAQNGTVVSGEDPDEPVEISLFLQHDSNTDYFMNTEPDDPTDDIQVNDIIWDYGWWDGENVVDKELLSDLNITGTFDDGHEIFVELSITNPAWSGAVDVTMQLLDENEVIAEITETLNGQIGGGEENSVWRLPFNGNADSPVHHTFEEDHMMSVHMTTDGGNVNVDYRNGDAHVEFLSDHIKDEEFHVEDGNGKDKVGEEFTYYLPALNVSTAHFHGSLLDSFTYRDVRHINIEAEGPNQMFRFEEIQPEHRSSDDHVEFHYNWSIWDEDLSEADAGEYQVSFEVIDRNGHNFTYDLEYNFTISKYGAWIGPDASGNTEKDGNPGETVSFGLFTFNCGIVNDTFDLDHDSLPSGWQVEYDPDDLVIDSLVFIHLTLNVTIPEDANPGDYVDITTTFTSRNSTTDPDFKTASWQQEVTVRVSASVGISVFYRASDSDDDGSTFDDTHHKDAEIGKGEEHDYLFRVRNTGEGGDEITLSVDGIPEGWGASFLDPQSDDPIDSIFLESNDEFRLAVRVTAPSDAQYSSSADLEITGTSTNDDSISDTSYLSITIRNEPPTAEIISVSPSPAMDDEEIILIGLGQDIDGTIEAYQWTSSIDGVLYEGSNPSISRSDLSLGDHTITLKVKDDSGAWSDGVIMGLLVHDRPVAEIISITPDPADFGEAVEFIGSGTDNDGIAWYLWTSDIDGLLSNGTASQLTSDLLSPGTHTISLQVRDSNDGWSYPVEEILLVEEPNSLPGILIISPIDNATVRGTVYLTGTMSDIDGSVEFVEVRIQSGDWIKLSGGTQWTYEWNTKDVSNGQYVISVRSYDGTDYSVVASFTLTVDNEGDDGGDSFIPGFGVAGIVFTLLFALFHRRKR